MMGTKGKLLLAAAIVGGALVLVLHRAAPPTRKALPVGETGHAVEIDQAMAAVLALQHAPEGATPCESAYNAFKASYDVSQSQNVKAVVLSLAARDEFLTRCAALPPGAQACLVPRYSSRHRDECDHARATPETLAPMVELLQRTLPGARSDDIETPPMGSELVSAPRR